MPLLPLFLAHCFGISSFWRKSLQRPCQVVFFFRFSKDFFFWLQRLAFIAHCSLVYISHFFSQLPDTFFPQSSHIALELFSPVRSRQVGAFSQTSRHLQSHLAAKLSTEPFFTFTITSRLLTVRICLIPFC